MCDQDHFEDDKRLFEAGGMVTRRQFGALLGAGMTMMLPKVMNAVAVTESEVTVKTPDGTCDCYFVHPASGTAPGVLVWPDIFGLRPAFRQMGKRLAESGYSVLVVNPFYRVKKAPTAENGAATPIPQLVPLDAGAQRDHAHDRCEGVHRLAGSAAVGRARIARSARRATAWAARSRSAPRPRCPIASARSPRSTAADWSPTSRTVRICRPRRPRRSS